MSAHTIGTNQSNRDVPGTVVRSTGRRMGAACPRGMCVTNNLMHINKHTLTHGTHAHNDAAAKYRIRARVPASARDPSSEMGPVKGRATHSTTHGPTEPSTSSHAHAHANTHTLALTHTRPPNNIHLHSLSALHRVSACVSHACSFSCLSPLHVNTI